MPSPSAQTLLDLEQLLLLPAADRGWRAWELVVRAQANPDFHVVLDYALDKELVIPCVVADPKREPNLTWTNPIDGSEMVWIPPGPFRVGEDKTPAVCGGFSLAKYPVTNEQFSWFIDVNSYEADEDVATDDAGYRNGEFLQHWPGKPDHPVVFVSYFDALVYCWWAGLSVPGEYQWEKAARGPDGRTYPWGDADPRGTVWRDREIRTKWLTNYRGDDTLAVEAMRRVRSPYGCEQMAGNVSTWCQPGDEAKPGEFPPVHREPKATGFAAVRGGAYKRRGEESLRTFHRRKLSVIRRNDWTGIRPACFLPVRPAV